MKEAQTDIELLRAFVESSSESAFAELVQRHIDLVYSVALRQLRGDSHLARDATQAVFCELARNARKLRGHQALSGWLYTTTRFVASRISRSESRRAAREQAFAMNTNLESTTEDGWKEVENLLDDAMQDLSSGDREAVLLRYFRNESFGAIGAVFGASENAARMRVERALEKLRTALGRRGVTCPSAVLSALLAANAISVAPTGLAATVAVPAIATAAAASGGTVIFNLLDLMATAKIKLALAAITLAGTTTGWIVAQKHAAELEKEVTVLKREAAARQSNLNRTDLGPGESQDATRLRADRSELMRLRGEVTELRRQLREIAAAAPFVARKQGEATVEATPEDEAKEQLKRIGIAKLNVAKNWGLAFYRFAQTNRDLMPADFQQANYPELSQELSRILAETGVSGADGEGFEITFQGRLGDIENPAQAIILREKEPFQVDADGGAQKTYLFADGHSEIHKARDGNFEQWEAERVPKLKGTQADTGE